MREVDTASPVVWPAWCYSGEGVANETESGSHPEPEPAVTVTPVKPRAKRRGVSTPRNAAGGASSGSGSGTGDARDTMNGTLDHQNNNNNNNNPVKNERLSPTNCTNADNNSSSSRSGTPSSSYPGTPPAGDRGSSPSSSSSLAALPTAHHSGSHLKSMEQMMSRNYSDFMRSLAAKYNNSNPNDYFNSTRNGFSGLADPRFPGLKPGVTTPFAGLMSPLITTSTSPVPTTITTTAAGKKETTEPDKRQPTPADTQQLFANFGMSSFTSPNVPRPTLPMFPSMVDMSSTQMLLNMVRSASAQNAQQLESYLKGANKRFAESTNNPLDLSPGACAAPAAATPTPPKKSRKHQPSLSESLYGTDALMPLPMLTALQKSAKDRLLSKRTGTDSLSPKPRPSKLSIPSTPPLSTVAGSRLPSGAAPPCLSLCSSAERGCSNSADAQAIAEWNVNEVCAFVSSIDICAEYVSEFRDQRIDGSSLSLLTEEHLTATLGMKLGPALKLRSVLSKKLGHCAVCMHCVHCHSTVSSPTASPSPRRPSSTGN